jgi:hypothetical protein
MAGLDRKPRRTGYRCFLPDLAEFTGSSLPGPSHPAYPRVAFLAERVGFEPTVPLGTHDFQSCTFGHSVTSPGAARGRLTDCPCTIVNCQVAEREGFEPPVPCGTPDFESGAFDQLGHLSAQNFTALGVA